MSALKVLLLLIFFFICNTYATNELEDSTVIQVGTYAKKMLHIAEQERDKYIKQGYDAYLVPVLNPTPKLRGKYYRLRIGSLKKASDIATLKKTIQSNGTKPWIDNKTNDTVIYTDTISPNSLDSITRAIDSLKSDTVLTVDFSNAVEPIILAVDTLAGYPKIEPEFFDHILEAQLKKRAKRLRRISIITRISTGLLSTGLFVMGYLYNKEADELYDAYLSTTKPLPVETFDAGWKEIEDTDRKRDLCYTTSSISAGLYTATFFFGRKDKNERRKRK